MGLYIQVALNSIILSSMYLLAALGFAFLLNMLGVLNLAHGSIYMLGAYLALLCINQFGFDLLVGFLLSVLVLGSLGILLERVCIRPFIGDFDRIVMVTVALAVILQTTVNIIAGSYVASLPRISEGTLRWSFVSISKERLTIFVTGLILTGGVFWFVKKTLLGLQMQAIAQDFVAAALQGVDVYKASSIVCAAGCALAAVAGCFLGSYLGIGPFMGDTMLLKVLVIVFLAGVGSVGGLLVSSLMLGTLDSILPIWTQGALSDAIGTLVVLAVLVFRPKGLWGRELYMSEKFEAFSPDHNLELAEHFHCSRKQSVVLYLSILTFLLVIPLLRPSGYLLHVLTLWFLYMITALSFRTILISGQYPLAHAAFMGIGAYVAGMTSKWLNWPPALCMPISTILTTGIGMLFAYPFCRLKALYYAMASLFFGIAVIYFISAGGIWTGGYSGLIGVPPLFAGYFASTKWYFLNLIFAIMSALALYRFETCDVGKRLAGIAQSDVAMSSVGVNVAMYKTLAVGVGCFFAGLSGSLYAFYNEALSPTSFNFMATLWITMFVLVGGRKSFFGPIVGSAALFLVPEFLRVLKTFSPYLSAGILLGVAYFCPYGLVFLPNRFLTKVKSKGKSDVGD